MIPRNVRTREMAGPALREAGHLDEPRGGGDRR
jgi:hypothetical protein